MVIDWNPAADQQALARVWRDGQKKECEDSLVLKLRIVLNWHYKVSFIALYPRALSKRRFSNDKLPNKLCRLLSSTRRKTQNVISPSMLFESYSLSKKRLCVIPMKPSNANVARMGGKPSRLRRCCTAMRARTSLYITEGRASSHMLSLSAGIISRIQS